MNVHLRAPAWREETGHSDRVEAELIEGVEGLAALRAEWDALFARAGRPHQLFQRHAMLMHWADHFSGPRIRLWIVTVRRNGRLAIAWPLVQKRCGGLSVLLQMGEPIAQFGDLLAEADAGPAEVEAAWSTVARLRADLLLTRNVRADSALERVLSGRAVRRLRSTASPFARLACLVGPDGPGERYAPKYRSNYRRRLRKLEQGGTIGFRALPATDMAAAVERAIWLKRTGLPRGWLRACPLHDERFLAYFLALCADAGSCGLAVSTVEADGEAVAIDLSLDCKGTSFGYLTVHDPACSRDGLGTILIHHALKTAQERGNTTIDMMAPANDYKLAHAQGITPMHDYGVAFSLAGRAALSLCPGIVRAGAR